MTLPHVRSWVRKLLADVYKARPTVRVAEWAKANVNIPASISPEFPGPYDVERTPLADILFQFYESPDYDEFICPKSSQAGLSQAGHVIICYDSVFRGRDIILLLDSETEARRVGRKRLRPLILACKALATKVGEAAESFTALTLYLKGVAIYLMGSFSPSALANKTVGLVIADECDNYPASPKGESNALDLVRDRVKKVVGAKIIAFSKPKDEDSLIWPEYLTGSRHKCFVPCPSCSSQAGELAGFQELVWKQVRFDHCKDAEGNYDFARVESETYYQCVHCAGKITERDKPWMVENRRWESTNKGQDEKKPRPRKMSAHISDLYSLFSKDTWGRMAVEWIDAQGSVSKVMLFIRGRLGLPWKKDKVEVDRDDIYKMVSAYRRGQCPVEPDLILMGVDNQKDVRKWIKVAFAGTDCYVIDWGETLTLEALIPIADQPVEVLDWNPDTPEDDRGPRTVYKGMIDEGGEAGTQTAVRDFIVHSFISRTPTGYDYRFYSCYGRGGLSVKNWKDIVDRRPVHHRGWPLDVYRFNDEAFKSELYEQRFAQFKKVVEAQKAGEPEPSIPRVYFPTTIRGDGPISFDELVKELTQERREFDHDKGKWVWIDPEGPNDFGDCLKMCLVEWYMLQPYVIQARALRAKARAKAKAKEAEAAREN